RSGLLTPGRYWPVDVVVDDILQQAERAESVARGDLEKAERDYVRLRDGGVPVQYIDPDEFVQARSLQRIIRNAFYLMLYGYFEHSVGRLVAITIRRTGVEKSPETKNVNGFF